MLLWYVHFVTLRYRDLFVYVQNLLKSFLKLYIFICLDILSQQSQKADLTLLKFSEELKHIEAASR